MSITRRDLFVGAACGLVGGAIGAGALSSLTTQNPINVADYRKLAQSRLPKMVFDYLEGGAGDERALAHNRAIFDRVNFQPKRLTDVSKRDLSIELFGKTQAAPIMVAPTGLNGCFWPNGDIALARAAERAGVPFGLSSASTSTIEEVAEGAGGDKWFQLYVLNRAFSEELVQRAKDAGYTKLVLTTDVGVNGLRERDVRSGFKVPMKITPSVVLDGVTHPRWSFDFMMNGMPQLANFVSKDASDVTKQAAIMSRAMDASFDWEGLKWLRTIWPHELLVKGILRADDAVKCIDAGADGVILSNHGGRQLNDALAPFQVIAETRSRITQPILVDSGYRRGSDIVKALALGANTVLLGKAVLYGLAARGEQGASEVIKLLMAEIDNTLAQIGCPNARDLTPEYIVEDNRPLMVP
ncbi:alpha-hydroxy-acid oxidizing protein [Agrobacterium tumefaciens]|uniref:alpha-hydroxy-acid oxidizing protein n=1 Tax=Agrobacterium tumefaciens TaxID=358 RepID=UPI002781E2B1|nr:alpha-hydroxy-acid oxidizing protein [Agrobacterium tumefaciens]MDP9857405.1 (S)-mandelate dehydrogenase [Agrobacterium tumefaciens]